jgi:hypothetical protein
MGARNYRHPARSQERRSSSSAGTRPRPHAPITQRHRAVNTERTEYSPLRPARTEYIDGSAESGMKLFTIIGPVAGRCVTQIAARTSVSSCCSASGGQKFMDPVVGSASGLAPSHHTTKPISTTSWEARFRSATKSALSNKCWLPSRDTTNRTSRRSYAPACLRDSCGSAPPLGSRRGTRTRDTGTAMAGRSGPPAGLSCQCECVLR